MINIFVQELLPKIKDYEVVLFGMSINNSFAKGLLEEIALNFPKVKEEENRQSAYGDKTKYGKIFSVEVDGIVFCACYMNDGGYNKKKNGLDYVDYKALSSCLSEAKKHYGGKKICAPIIGNSFYDGNGNKEQLLKIFKQAFDNCDIDLYDYVQRDFGLEIHRKRNKIYKDLREGKISREEYLRLRSELYWQQKHGVLSRMPEDFFYSPDKKILRVKKEDLEKE